MTINEELDEIKKRRKTRLSNFELWWQEKGYSETLETLQSDFDAKDLIRKAFYAGAKSGRRK